MKSIIFNTSENKHNRKKHHGIYIHCFSCLVNIVNSNSDYILYFIHIDCNYFYCSIVSIYYIFILKGFFQMEKLAKKKYNSNHYVYDRIYVGVISNGYIHWHLKANLKYLNKTKII